MVALVVALEAVREVVMAHALQVAGKHVLGVDLAVQNHAVHTIVVEDVSNIVQVIVLGIVSVALIHVKTPVKEIVLEDASKAV